MLGCNEACTSWVTKYRDEVIVSAYGELQLKTVAYTVDFTHKHERIRNQGFFATARDG